MGFQSYTLVIPPFPYMMLAVTMAALAVISRSGGSHPYVALSWERRAKHSCTKKYAHIGSEKATFRLPLAILLGIESQTRQMEKLKTSIVCCNVWPQMDLENAGRDRSREKLIFSSFSVRMFRRPNCWRSDCIVGDLSTRFWGCIKSWSILVWQCYRIAMINWWKTVLTNQYKVFALMCPGIDSLWSFAFMNKWRGSSEK